MNINKVILFVICFMWGIQAQGAVNIKVLETWSSTVKQEDLVTRGECRGLLEKTVGATINRPELTAKPEEYMTREVMALMLVNALGYEGIASQLNSEPKSFTDISQNIGAIKIVKDLGLINGDSSTVFNPSKQLTVYEVTTIIKRLGDKLNTKTQELHGSYAIKSSEQMLLIKNMDAVSFGWSQVEYDSLTKKVSINTTSRGQNDFNVPLGAEVPLGLAKQEKSEVYLMVYLNNRGIDVPGESSAVTLAAYIFDHKEQRAYLIDEILKACDQIAFAGQISGFDGVTIDFENFYEASLKAGFNIFLKELKEALDKSHKKLNVALQPSDYYKGYDYKTIGQIADRVILMAHDYAPKRLTDTEMQTGFTITPITPIHKIYQALKEITDTKTGISADKVMLQISFASTQWQVKDNQIINRLPYTPSYDKIFARLKNPETQRIYSDIYQNPYALYYDGNIKNIIWYEDLKSVQAKIELAKMFGIHKISLWRLGTIPQYKDDTQKTGLDFTAFLLSNE